MSNTRSKGWALAESKNVTSCVTKFFIYIYTYTHTYTLSRLKPSSDNSVPEDRARAGHALVF